MCDPGVLRVTVTLSWTEARHYVSFLEEEGGVTSKALSISGRFTCISAPGAKAWLRDEIPGRGTLTLQPTLPTRRPGLGPPSLLLPLLQGQAPHLVRSFLSPQRRLLGKDDSCTPRISKLERRWESALGRTRNSRNNWV